MEITEVRVKLMEDSDDRLQAFCSITFDDCFVVRDLKIIEGSNGPFVAMPSRKLTSHCHRCGSKNHLRAPHCNQCGTRLNEERAVRDDDGRIKLYADIAHPINSDCREMIQQRVIEEYEAEVERSEQPGYSSRYDEDYDDLVDLPEDLVDKSVSEPKAKKSAEAGFEKQHIEPPEPEPRGPHLKQAKEKTSKSIVRPPRNDDFGAGIF